MMRTSLDVISGCSSLPGKTGPYLVRVLYYTAVDPFGFHQSYSLVNIAEHWWKRTQLSYVFYMERCVE
ncbi:hypothetical protein SFRURICE_002936 [Spodoptera frugiperda]|nr:hypothetical protein SFRURICE_002936 [Spodoptera frugiperda]